MAEFEISTDVQSGMVVCRIRGFLADEEAPPVAGRLLDAVTAVRRAGRPLRMLFDRRAGAIFSARAATVFDELKPIYIPSDRTAVLVADSLGKLQSKRTAGPNTAVFLSEDAAVTWLTAYD